jgi:hypothetical protein
MAGVLPGDLYMGKRERFLAAGIVLLAGIICIGIVAAAPITVFSDNFNDNTLDTAKWTLDLVGGNCAFAEQNSRAEFQTNAIVSGDHAYLNSKPIVLSDWDTIEITGTYSNTGYTSRTHIATVTDLDDPLNTISAELAVWGTVVHSTPEFWFYWRGGSFTTSAPGPSPNPRVVPFRLKITRTGFEYYEDSVLIYSAATPTMASSHRFQLQVGAWEWSPELSYTYIDEIVVQFTGAAVVDIKPDTLKLKSRSDKNAVTATIELAFGDVNEIDPASVILSYGGQHVHALPGPVTVGDTDLDGIPDLMVKFDRQEVAGIVVPGKAVMLDVSGTVDGIPFSGSDAIRVTA